MICLICRESGIVHGLTSVVFERHEMKLLIRAVPALVCPHCAEAYVDDVVAARLLKAADDILKLGLLLAAIEYNDLAF